MAFPRQKAGLAQPFFRGLQNQGPRIIQPQPQAQAAASPRKTANNLLAALTGELNQIRTAREAAQSVYEQYLLRIRQLEKASALQTRKVDQKTNHSLSQSIGGISSLHNEIAQVKAQDDGFRRKLEATRASFDGMRDLRRILAPLTSEFESFGNEFEKSMRDVDSLFENLAARVPGSSVPVGAFDFGREIELVKGDHENNRKALADIQCDLCETPGEVNEQLVSCLADRIRNLGVRIDALEKKQLFAIEQSQSGASEAQSAEFEFRMALDRSIETVMASFRRRWESIRDDVTRLRDERSDLLNETRERLANEAGNIAKIRRNRMEEGRPRTSKMQQIDELRETVARLRGMLKQNPRPPPVRVFYRFDPNPDVILVLDDGTVIC